MIDSEETRIRLIGRFKLETAKYLDKLKINLPRLMIAPEDEETTRQVFLLAHTIKGNVAMMLLLDKEFASLNPYAQKLETAALALCNHAQRPTQALLNEFYENISLLEFNFDKVA